MRLVLDYDAHAAGRRKVARLVDYGELQPVHPVGDNRCVKLFEHAIDNGAFVYVMNNVPGFWLLTLAILHLVELKASIDSNRIKIVLIF